ncbi:hypothetical protein LEP1GSC188_4844 [Leptospira weilii serovar Topaz str. LT2116]|uniref:Uncharacterized protein n=1 Tax=Leptospira weilii serovar Topaz str. LT2116 TaxID=1088540 RepID=M3GU72_9LEPT|nr:hypothetical protein LEP1GSC188_4844 [Leptospira weilii serovar Topaz str. LT2116]
MKIVSIEFSHGPVSVYAHSFESERVTKYVKEYLHTFPQFQDVTHELTPGIGRVTICSSCPSVIPFEFSNTFGTLILHFSTGRDSINHDVILSSLQDPDEKMAIARIIKSIRNLISLNKVEYISA